MSGITINLMFQQGSYHFPEGFNEKTIRQKLRIPVIINTVKSDKVKDYCGIIYHNLKGQLVLHLAENWSELYGYGEL